MCRHETHTQCTGQECVNDRVISERVQFQHYFYSTHTENLLHSHSHSACGISTALLTHIRLTNWYWPVNSHFWFSCTDLSVCLYCTAFSYLLACHLDKHTCTCRSVPARWWLEMDQIYILLYYAGVEMKMATRATNLRIRVSYSSSRPARIHPTITSDLQHMTCFRVISEIRGVTKFQVPG